MTPFFIFVSGQSNAVQQLAWNWTPPANLHRWNNISGDPTSTGTAFAAPPNNVLDLASAFGWAVALAKPDHDIYVCCVGKAATAISAWLTGGDVRAAIAANLPVAMANAGVAAPNVEQWWQGENDQAAGNTNYVANFNDFQTWLCNNYATYQMPVLIHGLSTLNTDALAAYNYYLAKAAANLADVRTYIHTGIIPQWLWAGPDYLHLNGGGIFAAGQLAANALLNGAKRGASQGVFTDPHNLGPVFVPPQVTQYPMSDGEMIFQHNGSGFFVRSKIGGVLKSKVFYWD